MQINLCLTFIGLETTYLNGFWQNKLWKLDTKPDGHCFQITSLWKFLPSFPPFPHSHKLLQTFPSVIEKRGFSSPTE